MKVSKQFREYRAAATCDFSRAEFRSACCRLVPLLLFLCAPLYPAITAARQPDGSVVVESSTAKFHISLSGYTIPYLKKNGGELTIAATSPSFASDSVVVDNKSLAHFRPKAGIKIDGAGGGLGQHGKRVSIVSQSAGLQRTQTFELYENFPNVLLSTVTYQNVGSTPLRLDTVITQEHHLNAAAAQPGADAYHLWSFQGASIQWGKDIIFPLKVGFHQENKVGASRKNGIGGGIPVLAFWTHDAGLAIGHLETLPVTLDMPVEVPADHIPVASLRLSPETTLAPGQSYTTPLTFVSVYSGDFYQPLHLYSQILQQRGWPIPKPNDQDYKISWCGWGYLSDVTSKQMLGIIPKLKEYGIKWATLDDRWFDTYGDWNPRTETFPGKTLQNMVADYHRNGIKVQLWWLPIGVELPGPKRDDHSYIEADIVKKHPDWLILDKNGKPAYMSRHLGALCPALPEVQQYYRELTTKFIRDWGFDGHKLDNVFSIPPCYNPKHHHKSPYDSVKAMGDVYKAIFDTTRQLKPESVTQVCPCGTTPNIAWLPYMDQAVTADPVGSSQVRRRIKMYKGLLGPEAPVYGDHVELTKIQFTKEHEWDIGEDFASTIGAGGVVGTKFVWPQRDPKYKDVILTPEKDRLWKKWLAIYQSKLLSRGEFLDLYVYGYDAPEAYAIAKDGKMYYAFFNSDSHRFSGPVELRGLRAGKYKVFDYVNDRNLGTITAKDDRLQVSFADSLLVEATPLGGH